MMPSLLALLLAIYSVSIKGMVPDETERSLIVNGRIAEKGRYPYFVSLQHYGGGALIAPDIVLTAGHTKPDKHNKVKPHVGTYSFKTDVKGVDYEEFEIVEAVRHPGFVRINDDDFILDFTLLKLNESSKRPVVKLNRNNNIPTISQEVIAMGVGDYNVSPHKLKTSDVLREVNLNVISNDECRMASSEKRNLTYANRIYPSMMCTTGGPHNERDSCSYDSGSPIIIPGRHHDLLVGLVSWGEECGDPDFPAVNARVSQVSDWIDEVVCALSENPPADFCRPEKWRWPAAASTRPILLGAVALMAALVVVLRLRKRASALESKRLPPSEQTSLCDSLSSSDSDYEAVEIT